MTHAKHCKKIQDYESNKSALGGSTKTSWVG